MTTRQNFEETHKLDHAGELRGGGNFHGNRHPTIGRYSCRVRKWRGTACIRWLSPRITWIIVQYFVGKTIIYVLVSRPTQCTMSIAFTAGRPLSRRSERSVYRSRCYSLGCFWSVPGLSRTKNGPHKILLYYWSSWTQETEILYALQQKSTLVITPHVPVLLANESEDTLLRVGNFLWKEMDHNFEFESLFKKWSWWLEGNLGVPMKTRQHVLYNSTICRIVVCGDVSNGFDWSQCAQNGDEIEC